MKAVENYKKLLALLAPYQRDPVFPPPASESALLALQQGIEYPLPPELLAIYGLYDGGPKCADDPTAECILYSYGFLSTSEMLRSNASMRELRRELNYEKIEEDRDSAPSFPPGTVQDRYSCDGWIPFAHSGGGDYLAIDFAPGPNGVPGQIINFGRNDPAHFQIATDFDSFLERLLRDYEMKKFNYLFGDTMMVVDRWIKLQGIGGNF
jgi:cell wall assembly regulator SMI1